MVRIPVEGESSERERQEKILIHRKGKTYFSKKTERRFFFVLTVMMLLWGILVKLNIL